MALRSLRSTLAAFLVMVLGVLHTGLPSHSHAVQEAGEQGGALQVEALHADSHAHGTILVEQDERVQSPGIQLPAIPGSTALEPSPPPFHPVAEQHGIQHRPSGRSPPPGAPRAPPVPHLI